MAVDAGALAEDAYGHGLAGRVLSCPPDSCLPFGCPGHEFSRKGLDGCGIDTRDAAVGTQYSLNFVVFDHNVPPLSVTVTRYVSIVAPCTAEEIYCPNTPSQMCGSAPCAVREQLADPEPPAPPKVVFSTAIIPDLVIAARIDMHVICGGRPSPPAVWCDEGVASSADCMVRVEWPGGNSDQLVRLTRRKSARVQCTPPQISAGVCEDCSLAALNSGLCYGGTHLFEFSAFEGGVFAASEGRAEVGIAIAKRLASVGASVTGTVTVDSTAVGGLPDDQLKAIIAAFGGQGPLTNELLWAAREALQEQLAAAMQGSACAPLVHAFGAATAGMHVEAQRTAASLSAIATPVPGGNAMLVQVRLTAEWQRAGHVVHRTVFAGAQVCEPYCCGRSLSSMT